MKYLTIIDTFGFLFRSFYALPNFRNKDGFPTGLLTGFANFIYTIKEEFPTDYILFALDAKGKTFRHTIDKNYKANRKEAPEDLKKQLPIAIEWIKKMESLGAGEILLTSIDMDGTKDGYDIDLTREIVNSVSIPVVASGGCGKPEDMIGVFKKTDVEAALAASIFHYETHSVNRVKKLIKENGIPVRI